MPLIDVTIDPIIVQLGPFQLGWHGIFSVLAIVAGVRIGLRGAARRGLPAAPIQEGLIWAFVGAVVGARLFHVADHLPYYGENPLDAFAVWRGGIAVYGGFIGGVAAGAIAARLLGVPVWPILDAAASGMLVGQAVGRIGCLINGDAWGGPTGCPCGIVYWHDHAVLPPDLIGVPTHPYPLYEIGAVVALLLGLWVARRWVRSDGRTFLVAVIGYAVIRFGLTFFRQEAVLIWGLQEAQVVALATGLAALGALLRRRRRGGVRPADATSATVGGP